MTAMQAASSDNFIEIIPDYFEVSQRLVPSSLDFVAQDALQYLINLEFFPLGPTRFELRPFLFTYLGESMISEHSGEVNGLHTATILISRLYLLR